MRAGFYATAAWHPRFCELPKSFTVHAKHKMNPLVWAETELACENLHSVCKQVHSNQALHHCALRLHWELEGTDIGPTDGCLAHPRQPPPPIFRPFQAWALQLPDT